MSFLCKIFVYYLFFSGCQNLINESYNEEEYDPDNLDDIFGGLDQRINELKIKFSTAEKYFLRKKRIAPTMCIICFEEFKSDGEVIQL